MVAQHLLDEQGPKGLKDLAIKVLGKTDVVRWEEAIKAGKDSDKFAAYATADAEYTWELCMWQQPKLKEQGLAKLFREIEMPFQLCLVEMETAGFLVDQEKIAKTTKEIEDAAFHMEVDLHKQLGIPFSMQANLFDGSLKLVSDFNFNSSTQLAELLYDKLQLPVVATTESGARATGKEALEKLKDKHPVVSLLYKYKKAQKLLSAFFKPLPEFIDPDGRVRAHFNPVGTATGRLSCSEPNLQQLPKVNKEFPVDTRSVFVAPEGHTIITCDYCLSPDTEILTPDGWVLLPLLGDEQVAQWSNGQITFVTPLRKVEYAYKGPMIHWWGTKHVDLLMTPDHRCIVFNPEYDSIQKVQARDLKNSGTTINAGMLSGTLQAAPDLLKLVAAIQADGSIKPGGRCVFWLKKGRKISRLVGILEALGIAFTSGYSAIKGKQTSITFYTPVEVYTWMDSATKTFNRKLLQLTPELRQQFIEETLLWDGSSRVYYSSNLENCRLLQELCVLTAIKSNLSIKHKGGRKPCGEVSILRRAYTHNKTLHKDVVDFDGRVYCVEVPAGAIVVRRNNKVSITGNCGQELRILAQITQEPTLIEAFKKGKDIHLATANDFFNLQIPDEGLYETSKDYETYKKKFKAERDKAKIINFGIAYGKGAYGFSKDFNISEKEAEQILDKYFRAMPRVKQAIAACEAKVRKDGFVVSGTGRRRRFTPHTDGDNKFYPRAAFREAFNFLIQGYAADMVRLASIRTYRLSREQPKWELTHLASVHDENVYSCKSEYVQEASKAIKDEFEAAVTFDMPIVASIGTGRDYGEAK
jgi:DNA polymerase I-like protein with 3'-5' exonuclease and polymerase domains